ncbi:hypothetical protein [Shewanella sp.]|uniref:hypothetical protein n=1 Tax=Shewanella sp. TaxID=50422 RepID=UPI003A973C70
MKSYLMFAAVLLCLTFTHAGYASSDDSDPELKQAVKQIDKNLAKWELVEAQHLLDEMLPRYPDSAELALVHGKFLYVNEPRQFAKAIAEFDRAEQLGLRDPELYFYRASAKSQPTESYLKKQHPDYAGALDDFHQAQQRHSKRDLRFNIVDVLYEDGKYQQALAAVDNLIYDSPRNMLIYDFYITRGNIQAQLGQHDEALQSYRVAEKQYHYLDKLHLFKAVSLLALDRTEDALTAVNEGLSKPKGHNKRQLYYVRGMIHYQRHEFAEAFTDFSDSWKYAQQWALPLLGCYNSIMQTDLNITPDRFLDLALKLDPNVVLHFNQQDLLKL